MLNLLPTRVRFESAGRRPSGTGGMGCGLDPGACAARLPSDVPAGTGVVVPEIQSDRR
jgi:hypothetical protein